MPPEIDCIRLNKRIIRASEQTSHRYGRLAAPVLREAYRTLRDDSAIIKMLKLLLSTTISLDRSITVAGLLTGQDLPSVEASRSTEPRPPSCCRIVCYVPVNLFS